MFKTISITQFVLARHSWFFVTEAVAIKINIYITGFIPITVIMQLAKAFATVSVGEKLLLFIII
jgi:hypothetical protein